ncbi:MAG: MBL fold metallo-hydrolase [Clostridiales bacterium]|nr:MBL fold metallo-hydrolase [Clostridiales bacterium]
MAKFCPLFSGSGGNCTYIGNGSDSILIDLGISAKRTKEALYNIGVDDESIKAVFITHEHSDHVSGFKVFSKNHRIKYYMTQGTYDGMKAKGFMSDSADCVILKDDAVEIGDMQISKFNTSHDTLEPCGFTVNIAGGRRISVVTDLGIVTDEVMDAVNGSDLVLLESNHDINMLQCGSYSYQLKRRILGIKGHLSNDSCAQAAKTLVENGTTRLVLGHLSKENNLPELAYKTTVSTLNEAGMEEGSDYLIRVAKPQWDEKAMIL